MLPRKILHTVMAILALFEQLSGKVCSNFWPLTLIASPNMMHVVRTVSTMRALKATKTYCYEEVRSYGKILFIPSIVENGDASPTLPLDPPLAVAGK